VSKLILLNKNILPMPRLYSVGSLVTSLGPEPDPAVWKIYDGIEIQDGKVMQRWFILVSIFSLSVPGG
jgi:hypothetical protein